jgi:2-polyprenyl-3-methyl-5-hydroxy-6-metoxy-1,4-benzoquinol methylase
MEEMRAESDRARWDRKYAAGEGPAHFRPKTLLTRHRHLLGGVHALDVACGFGGNALYLASMGYRVDAVDASGVALAQAQAAAAQRGLQINFIQADLSRWWVPAAHYDLIAVFFYLNRPLTPQLAAGLRPGGLLFQANRNKQFLPMRPDFDPDYLLEPGELHRLARAAGLEVVHHTDGTPDEPHTSQLIARRPDSK